MEDPAAAAADPAPESEPEPEHKRPPSFCHYCNDDEPWEDPRAFGIHLERHREVKKPTMVHGKVTSTPCPHECGRHFFIPSEYREHVPSCDGQPPLCNVPREKAAAAPAASPEKKPEVPSAPKKEKIVAKKEQYCECGAGPWKDMRGVAAHKRGPNCSMKKSAGAPASPAKPSKPAKAAKESKPAQLSRDASTSGNVAHLLRHEAQQLRDKATKLEKMADEVESLL
jgi:hypothetical protein